MIYEECMKLLEEKGDAATRKVYINNHAALPVFGVKMGELRKIAALIGIDHALGQELYASGIHDAMLLAEMIVDKNKLSRADLDHWVANAKSVVIAERCVAPLAALQSGNWEIADAWARSDQEPIACAGYAIYGMLFARIADKDLDLAKVKGIIDRIEQRVKVEKPFLQYAMNNCLIMAGMFIAPLSGYCKEVADRIGYVKPTIKVNNCNIQSASDYIARYAGKAKVKSF
jgi:3-methyladenine DNA glycosylase AlkD